MGGPKSQLALIQQPQEFFKELVSGSIKSQKVRVSEDTEFYLVNLMNRFLLTNQLYTTDTNGSLREEPLSFLLKEAIESPSREEQLSLFRHLGDVSLYVSGFFQDSLHRKLVDIDYYIGIGAGSYQNAAGRAQEEIFKKVYSELAHRFSNLVDVLAEISSQTMVHKEHDLLRLYEIWLKTGSERAEKALKKEGIVPNRSIKPDIQ